MRDLLVPERKVETILADAPFVEAVRRFSTDSDLKAIFVVDAEDRLGGILTRHDLLLWASAAFGDHRVSRQFHWQELTRVAQATTALSACREDSAVTVSPDDLLIDAFDSMVRHQTIDLPVVDDEGRIVGDLRLSEVLAKVLEEL